MISFWYKRNDKRAGEGEIENGKVCFITNFHLFRVGNFQQLQRWLKSKKDQEWKDWEYPLQDSDEAKHTTFINNRCMGKNVTDSVEALACALFLSTKCIRSVLDWISNIKLVPIKLADEMIEKFKYNVDYTLRLYKPLNKYAFKVEDSVRDIFEKYFRAEGEKVEASIRDIMLTRICSPLNMVGDMGDKYEQIKHLKGQPLIQTALNIIEEL
jgi:hypothetical protein